MATASNESQGNTRPILNSSNGNTAEAMGIVNTQAVLKRLQSELITRMNNGEAGTSAFPDGENIFSWKGTIMGSKDTILEGSEYKLSLSFPNECPIKPLKKKRTFRFEDITDDQEMKFLGYVSAAEELVQHLQEENDKLNAQLQDLLSEVVSIRSSKDQQCAEYQKMLIEENQRRIQLSEEVERLRQLQKESDEKKLASPEILPSTLDRSSEETNGSMTVKRPREVARDETEEESTAAPAGSPAYQSLVEYLVGLKLSTLRQTHGTAISALHQSSGYSFSLTWVNEGDGEEAQLLYRVSELGTFERIAPEWMRSALMFSINMCPIFFERVARVIKLHR